jgi:hypothetical protein
LRRFAKPLLEASPPLLNVDEIYIAPLPEFGAAAAATGFVDYRFSSDGVVRVAPMLLAQGKEIYPQIGLSMACRMLGVTPESIEFTESEVILPCADGRRISIPVHTLGAGSPTNGYVYPLAWTRALADDVRLAEAQRVQPAFVV